MINRQYILSKSLCIWYSMKHMNTNLNKFFYYLTGYHTTDSTTIALTDKLTSFNNMKCWFTPKWISRYMSRNELICVPNKYMKWFYRYIKFLKCSYYMKSNYMTNRLYILLEGIFIWCIMKYLSMDMNEFFRFSCSRYHTTNPTTITLTNKHKYKYFHITNRFLSNIL